MNFDVKELALALCGRPKGLALAKTNAAPPEILEIAERAAKRDAILAGMLSDPNFGIF